MGAHSYGFPAARGPPPLMFPEPTRSLSRNVCPSASHGGWKDREQSTFHSFDFSWLRQYFITCLISLKYYYGKDLEWFYFLFNFQWKPSWWIRTPQWVASRLNKNRAFHLNLDLHFRNFQMILTKLLTRIPCFALASMTQWVGTSPHN